jgi:hypothetical protein
MGILQVLLPGITSILNKIIPDPAAKAAAQLQLAQLAESAQAAELDAQLKTFLAGAGIVQAEAQSSNWLTASWRPITMLVFVALIVARIFGFTSEHISEAEYMQLWDLVKLGLGGYVVGRSVEKVVPGVVAAVKGMSK